MENKKTTSSLPVFWQLLRGSISSIFGVLSLLYGFFAFYRDEILRRDVADKWRLGGVVTMISWYSYIIVGLFLLWVGTTYQATKMIVENNKKSVLTYIETFNYYEGKKSNLPPVPTPVQPEDKIKKEILKQDKEPKINVFAPLPHDYAGVVKFQVYNNEKSKLEECFIKLSVMEKHVNADGQVIYFEHPAEWYPKALLWGKPASEDGKITIAGKDREFLDAIELGKEHFRFLFHGDIPLPEGTYEPENLSKAQYKWLDHPYIGIRLDLFGVMDGNDVHVSFIFVVELHRMGTGFMASETRYVITFVKEDKNAGKDN